MSDTNLAWTCLKISQKTLDQRLMGRKILKEGRQYKLY